MMTDAEQRKAAREFAAYWKDRGYEKGDSQPFWLSLLRNVLGVEEPEKFIEFEDQVHLDNTSFIDGYIPSTRILIEQKGLGKNLNRAIRQSDGSSLTPFQQAKRYITELPVSRHPRWVVTCNFAEFWVYDMEKPGGDPEVIKLADLEKEYYRLHFLVKTSDTHLQKEMEVSIAAGDIVGMLYDAFSKQYADPNSERAMKSLNVLCVRLVFCLYAEDAGIFGHHGMFHDYLAEFDARKMRRALTDLFKILDTKPEDRDPYLKDDFPELAALYKGVVMTASKFILGVALGMLVAAFFGDAGILGLTPFVIIAAITISNSSLYISLSSQFGNASDTGAVSILSLNDGPFFTLVALGATGLADIPVMTLIATIVPLLIGFIWGNLDAGFRETCKTAQPIVTFFMTISIGAKTSVATIITAGASGIILGLVSALTAILFFFVVNLFLPKKERNAMGAAIGTTALNSAQTPAAVGEADLTLESYVPMATAQCATASVITLFLCPFFVTFFDNMMRRKRLGIYSAEGWAADKVAAD